MTGTDRGEDERSVPLFCVVCRERIPPARIDSEGCVAQCARCGVAFSFESRSGSASTPRGRLPLPNGITIAAGEEERSNEGYRTRASNRAPLVITRRWFRPSYLAFLIFASLLDGLIVVLYLEPEPYGVGGLMSLVIAVVGIVTTYVALALVGNRTVIRVDARNIEVHHGPLPWKRPVVVDVARLRQVYVRYVWRRDGHASHTWNVEATNGTLVPIVLLGEILEREQAEHIWWALEDHLDLPASSLA